MISLAELQNRIDRGTLSPETAIAQSMQAIEAREPAVGAFVCRADQPRAASHGRLRGIAVGIKDIIDTADFPTEMGSSIYRGWRPRADAAVVAMLKRAGATIIGKTTTTAFAAHDPTATLNPHHAAHTPGGSSSAIIQEFEAHLALAWEYRSHHDALPPLLRAKLDRTADIEPAAYDTSRGIANRARRAMADMFGEVDVLLTFSAPGAAPKGLASTGDPRFNRLWTLLGLPCVNVPAHLAGGGLPVGVQVIARFGDDAGVLAAARFIENALARS